MKPIHRHLVLQAVILAISFGVFFDAPDKLNLSLNRFYGWIGYYTLNKRQKQHGSNESVSYISLDMYSIPHVGIVRLLQFKELVKRINL